MENNNIITKYPEGLDYLEQNLDIMGLPKEGMTEMRKAMVKSLIMTLARQ